MLNPPVGQLSLHIKKTDRFYFISEKIYPHRQLFRKRINIHDTPPDRKLTGFINKITPFKSILRQQIFYKRNRKPVPLTDNHRHFRQYSAVHHFFSQSFGKSNQRIHPTVTDIIQYFRSDQYRIIIFFFLFNHPPVRRRQKSDLLFIRKSSNIIIKISSLFPVIQHNHPESRTGSPHSSDQQRSHRTCIIGKLIFSIPAGSQLRSQFSDNLSRQIFLQ